MTKSGYDIDRDERGFTKREREVLKLLAQGKSQSEIGRQLELSRQRVSSIVRSLKEKGVL